jgi:hypothetical protein
MTVGLLATWRARGGVGLASAILYITGDMADVARSKGSCLCCAALAVEWAIDALQGGDGHNPPASEMLSLRRGRCVAADALHRYFHPHALVRAMRAISS